MKKSFMTRALAMGLSLAMAFSLSAATNVTTAAAAAKPAMKSTKMTVKVGQSKNYAATAATQKAFKITKIKMSAAGKTKADVTINSSKKSIKVTGKAATKGSNVIITFKNNKTKKTSTVTTKVVVNEVKPAVAKLSGVVQKEARKFAATLSTAVDNVEAADFSIKRKADNAVIPIKTVKLDDAKTGVTIDTFVDMADGKEYEFKYTAKDEAKTVSTFDLTVTAGKVEKLGLTTSNVTAGTSDDGVKVVTKDANDVILNTYTFSEAAAKYITVTVTPTTAGYRDGNKIYLPEVGNTATVKVEYHTYKYVDNKEEGAVTETFTVTAVADATVMSNYVYTITTSASATEPAWASASFKENHTLAIGDASSKVWFKFKDSNDKDKTKGYKVSSSDSNVMLLTTKTLTGSNDGVVIAGANEGTAYIVIKNSKDELVTTLPVTVVAKKVATTLELSTQAVTVSNSPTANAIGTVKAYVKDQYGNKMSLSAGTSTSVAITPLSGPNNLDVTATGIKNAMITSLGAYTCSGETMTIAVSGKAFQTKGSYVYKIEVKKGDKKVTNSLTVNVSEPAAAGTNTSYSIELASADIDMVVDKENQDAKKMIFKIARLEDGVVHEYIGTNSVASISIKSADESSELKVVSGGVAGTATTIGALVTSGSAATMIEKMAKQDTTYVVKVTLEGGKDLTETFTVKDTQAKVDAFITNISDSINETSIDNALKCSTADGAKNHIEYFYDNQKKTINAADILKVKATAIAGQKSMTVYSVTVKMPIDTGVYMIVEVPVNKVFVTTNSSGWTTTKVVAP